MGYLAIDLGNKRVGIATSQQDIAFPQAVVQRTEIVKYLKKYFQEYTQCTQVIVGLPYDLYGKDTRQLDKTQDFIKKMQKIFPDREFIGHDERFSSFAASEGFGDHKDDIAAQCILQSYIDSKNK